MKARYRVIIALPLILILTLLYQEFGSYIASLLGYSEGTYVSSLSQQLVFLSIVFVLVILLSRYEYIIEKKISNPFWIMSLVPLPIIFLFSGSLIDIPIYGYIEIISITFLIAFNEEIIFRGFLQDYLKSLDKIIGCIFIALIFSFFHISNGTNSIILAFLLSVLFFFLRYKFNNLWPLIIAHMLIDISIFITRDNSMFNFLIYGLFGAYIVFLLCLLLFNHRQHKASI